MGLCESKNSFSIEKLDEFSLQNQEAQDKYFEYIVSAKLDQEEIDKILLRLNVGRRKRLGPKI
jgi:hypothetical protein